MKKKPALFLDKEKAEGNINTLDREWIRKKEGFSFKW